MESYAVPTAGAVDTGQAVSPLHRWTPSDVFWVYSFTSQHRWLCFDPHLKTGDEGSGQIPSSLPTATHSLKSFLSHSQNQALISVKPQQH